MKEAPFIRLVIPFIVGIAAAYYYTLPIIIGASVIAVCFISLMIDSFSTVAFRFKFPWIDGVLLNILLISFGYLITALNDFTGDVKKLEQLSSSGSPIIVSIKEPLAEKPKSFKALAQVNTLSANILVYFKKDSLLPEITYGDRIVFTKQLKPIENLPAFGTFDYKKYCALKNIHYQVFLKPNEFILLEEKDVNWFQLFLFDIQAWVIKTIRKYIPGKKESGLAEALLIGYKDDVDKELMKSYSNTGVIHVVAISGLHLGLIYLILKHLVRLPIPSFGGASRRMARRGGFISAIFPPIIIIAGLWIFSLLAGGSPSVLRSAVMFTFIVAGESFSRTTSIYNNLAASAFFLLCYNPYWLWDLGFQLSYFALLSIVVFQKPIYHLCIFKNKLLDNIWKLNAVTIAAQILTTPVCLFYFAQFPNLFLITNFIAVPLSSIILLGEILLCSVSFLPIIAGLTGRLLHYGIHIMNYTVEYLGSLPFSVATELTIDFPQLLICYSFILMISLWLLRKDKYFVYPALTLAILFFTLNLL
ncbi:MAG: ComEC/Rec2 family competence protein [Chitinophagaceae bacterium]|nr:ComEC/Rec2 family competence protein [Chitinophagaceae bacterium]